MCPAACCAATGDQRPAYIATSCHHGSATPQSRMKATQAYVSHHNNSKNKPRFLDYRQTPLPLDVALSFVLPYGSVEDGSTPRELILTNQVHVNDTIETNCHRLVCRYTDKITIHGIEMLRPIPMPSYFICYKPRGVICSNKRNEGVDRDDAVYISHWLSTAFEKYDYHRIDINSTKTINTVGRLDEESEGLLLLTNDGSFSRLLCDPEFGLAKTYRVVAKGSEFGRFKSTCIHKNATFLTSIRKMIERGNSSLTGGTSCENITVLDIGKLPSQHPSDDSYYVLVDLTLREGKTHAVRRIIKNSGLRVFFLSRIKVEGLDRFSIERPSTLVEAEIRGFLPIIDSKLTPTKGALKSIVSDSVLVLRPGDIAELNACHVDNIFSLRTS